MYLEHFGLNRQPFRITPDPDFFFPGGNRGAVLEALRYAVTRGEGIVKVVGEVGSGKTMLSRMLARELPDDCTLAFLANPDVAPDDIVRALLFELEVPVDDGASRSLLMQTLNSYLLAQHTAGRRVVVFVEEAQGMTPETLEAVRLLSNLETSTDKLLQIVLFGQPELDAKIDSHQLRQLGERITHSFALPPLSRAEIDEYLTARLRASGYRGNRLFTASAVRHIARESAGLLRRVNILADKSLLAAFAARRSTVNLREARRASADCQFHAIKPVARWWQRRLSLAAALVLGLGLIAGLSLVSSPAGRLGFERWFGATPLSLPTAAPVELKARAAWSLPAVGEVSWQPDRSLTSAAGDVLPPAGFAHLEAVVPELDAASGALHLGR